MCVNGVRNIPIRVIYIYTNFIYTIKLNVSESYTILNCDRCHVTKAKQYAFRNKISKEVVEVSLWRHRSDYVSNFKRTDNEQHIFWQQSTAGPVVLP